MWSTLIFICVFGCTSSLTNSFDVSGIISGNRMAGVPLGFSLGNGELDVEGICSEPGMACQNCTHAITCVSLPYGWLKMPLQECTKGFTCNAHERTCSENPVPECGAVTQNYTHTCEQVGIFPDAFDCRKFHLCSPPQDLPAGRPAEHRTALCPRHYAYNPSTAQCSIRLSRGQCDFKPVPDCETLGQADALPFSPNHYYVCLIKQGDLYPQVFICPHGWYFWDGFCRPEPQEQNPGAFDGQHVDANEHDRFEGKNGEQPRDNGRFSETNSKEVKDERNSRGFKETGEDLDGNNGRRDSSDEIKPKETAINFDKTNDDHSEDSEPKATTTRIDGFFSTEKSTTYAADTFLADKFDLTHYESTDDVAPSADEFPNSFESGDNFW